jgi:hypothetical protein
VSWSVILQRAKVFELAQDKRNCFAGFLDAAAAELKIQSADLFSTLPKFLVPSTGARKTHIPRLLTPTALFQKVRSSNSQQMWQITTSSNEKNARNFTSNEMKSTKYEGGTRFAQTNATEMILEGAS